MLTREGKVLAVTLAAVAVLANTRLFQPAAAHAPLDFKRFPTQIGEWKMEREFPVSQREIDILETDNILYRLYREPSGRAVVLALVYDPSGNRKMAHPQEVCLAAAGLRMLQQRDARLEAGGSSVQRLLMESAGPQRFLYYYWFKAGSYQSGSFFGSQLRLALASLRGSEGGASLVRINTRIEDGDEAAAEKTLQDFARDLQPQLCAFLP
ncbi:MAG TPA: EpsI family protein [Planctomycetota bacterium]|jgi:EpsI family protein